MDSKMDSGNQQKAHLNADNLEHVDQQKKVETSPLETHVTRSVASTSSKSSNKSSASMAATRPRARAEAMRARSSFLKRETELKVEKAQLKAQLQIEEARTEAALATLQQEKEYAAAIAEAKYLESAAADIDEDQRSIDSDVKSIPYECYDKRTIDYFNSQSRMRDTQPSLPQLERFTPPVQSYKGPHTLQHCDDAQQTIDTGDIRPNAALASINIPANHSTAHGKRTRHHSHQLLIIAVLAI
ncbi:hypothetical protein DPEC_G00187300 [Dallia pectoralis]|uniref:Uncharacterized protein n=1 Tax=Dallia pectoralis TaxID=75939 RepID=A0ACC2GBY5_DALPE|nr:hypothetical protein DPEC_G00187300 [Dallia pectoralis]